MHLFTGDMDYNDHCCYSLDGVFNAYISYIIWFFFFFFKRIPEQLSETQGPFKCARIYK